ncbi:hypothetical protein nbrc107696_37350 [Gordonia spumicola]|uniref:Uncharacterized protein n=1 Tax=Gordonia spumicola TaxID=589161 RepID=A0A7I9VD61_9ACTN|nr:hypothetical protein [Gordonia spumicola]GEE03289.1 hypothetical protein nbrc107696_37350 [Gordonia spumicola]
MSHYAIAIDIRDGRRSVSVSRAGQFIYVPTLVHGKTDLRFTNDIFESLDDPPQGLLESLQWESECGAALVDNDNRVILWAHITLLAPRVVTRLIHAANPGWSVYWCPEGVDDMITYAGLERAWPCRPAMTDRSIQAAIAPDFIHETVSILSVRAMGTVVTWQTTVEVDELSRASGSVVLRAALDIADSRRGLPHPHAWGIGWTDDPLEEPDEDWSYPEFGMLIDADRLRADWWTTKDQTSVTGAFAQNWPDFTVVPHGDDASWHESIAGLHGLHEPLAQNVRVYLDDVTRDTAEERGLASDHLAMPGSAFLSGRHLHQPGENDPDPS